MYKFFIKYFNEKIGEDEFGNIYYQSYKKSPLLNKKRRFVIYNDNIDEPSKISPTWHSWIHYLSDLVPHDSKSYYQSNDYQNEQNCYSSVNFVNNNNYVTNYYHPNLTLTRYKQNPNSLLNMKFDKSKLVSKNYNSWQPN